MRMMRMPMMSKSWEFFLTIGFPTKVANNDGGDEDEEDEDADVEEEDEEVNEDEEDDEEKD